MSTNQCETVAIAGGYPGDTTSAYRLAVVNAKGAPGTLACVAIDAHDKRRVFVTTHHLLFDADGQEGDPLWTPSDHAAGRIERPIGRALWGRSGIVRHRGRECYVDCAVASCEPSLEERTAGPSPPDLASMAVARVGERVFKIGHASGVTRGVVVAVDFAVKQASAGRKFRAPGQILVRADSARAPFLAAGDSGAMLRNAAGQALGLLWGVNGGGEGLACPIGAVVAALGLAPPELAYLDDVGARAA